MTANNKNAKASRRLGAALYLGLAASAAMAGTTMISTSAAPASAGSSAMSSSSMDANSTSSGSMGSMSKDSASTAVSPLASEWLAKGDVNFVQKEAFPNGEIEMKIAKGNDAPYVHLKDANFENGTIEFDVKPINDEWPTVRFRVHDESNAEEFYIRPGPDCAVAIDCLQYAPKMRGRMLWDSNYEYQHSAPFNETGWNHLKLVISGQRMNVYINHSAQPTLVVDELEGADGAGSVELQGPATFTNIVIAPGKTEGLSAKPLPDPTASDRGYLRHWQMLGAQPLMGHEEPGFSDMPNAQAAWTSIQAERLGLVNLARHFDRVGTHIGPYYTWLKTTVHSHGDQVKQVSLGYLRVVTVFVNGQPVYSGKNLYNTTSERQQPDGRLGLANGHFTLPLKRGDNQVVVALRSNMPDMSDQYGYGLRFRIDDAKSLESSN